MWALALVLWMQTPTVPNGVGWSFWSPTPLIAHAPTARRCVARHRGTKALEARLRCRVDAEGRMRDCEPADGHSLSRRDLATLQCLADSQRLPGEPAADTLLLTVTVVVPGAD